MQASSPFPRLTLQLMRPIMLTVVTLLITGCATLFNSGMKTVAMSSNPAGSEVWIDGTLRGTTPVSLDLNNHQSHTVVFRRAGHQEVTCQLTSSVGVGWVVLDVLGGLVPVIVDAVTGKWNSLTQGVCNVVLPALRGTDWNVDKTVTKDPR